MDYSIFAYSVICELNISHLIINYVIRNFISCSCYFRARAKMRLPVVGLTGEKEGQRERAGFSFLDLGFSDDTYTLP